MLVGLGAQADFLDLDLGLGFAGFAFLLGAFVDELAKVHHPADRRNRPCRDFHQIQFRFPGDLERPFNGHDPQILPGWTDQAHFRYPDGFINPEIYCTNGFLLFVNGKENEMDCNSA